MIMDIYDGRESMKDRPMKGFIQVLQVLLFFCWRDCNHCYYRE